MGTELDFWYMYMYLQSSTNQDYHRSPQDRDMNPLPIQPLLATYMHSAINHERQRSVKLSLNFVLRIITMQQIEAVKRSQKTRILIICVEIPPGRVTCTCGVSD